MNFVAVEMLIIELEAVGPQERPRRQRDRFEVHRPGANPEQAFDHRSDLWRGHVGPELRYLPIVAATLVDQRFAILEPGNEADAIEIRTVLGPVLYSVD